MSPAGRLGRVQLVKLSRPVRAMQRPRSILACVDFSACSASALKQAALLAGWADASLHVAHIVLPGVIDNLATAMNVSVDELSGRIIEESKQDLQKFTTDTGLSDATLHVAAGRPVDELEHLAEAVHADIVVLGVTGAGERGDGAGTTATQAARHFSVNVLLVHEEHDGPFERIVAAVDFSDASRSVLDAAGVVAKCDTSELHILHVYDAPWHYLHYRSASEESAPQFREQFVRRLQSRLEHFAEPVRSALPDERCTCALSDHRSYGFGIVDYATQHEADLVIMGTGSHSKLHRFFVGSTAERVLRETTCSVLVVRSTS